jgi:hypothetical protein
MPQNPEESKSLEMRIAAIEDKLAQLTVTEEEMQAYRKVAALMGGAGAAATTSSAAARIPLTSPILTINNPIHIIHIIYPIHIGPVIVNDCIQAPTSQAAGSGIGFGTLGKQS